jgi:hypothetical protein
MGQRRTAPGRIIRDKTSSAISSLPDIPGFLLLDDPANKLLLPFGLGTDRVLTLDWRVFYGSCGELVRKDTLLAPCSW